MDLKHWRLETDAENIAWLWFDRAGTATNTFSTEVLEELGRIADHLSAMPPKGLAILSAKENGFAAGADIDEFTTIASAEQAMAFTTLGNVVFDKIAALPFPTLAMGERQCFIGRGDAGEVMAQIARGREEGGLPVFIAAIARNGRHGGEDGIEPRVVFGVEREAEGLQIVGAVLVLAQPGADDGGGDTLM